jgi:L-asparaginase
MVILTNCEGLSGTEIARQTLTADGSPLDAIEQGIRAVEADTTVHSVGKGGLPNILGEVRCDAAIMDGTSLMAGAVGALKDYLHPISIARQVMLRLPHVLLTGKGAQRFAREIGAETAEMLTPEIKARHEQWVKEHIPETRLRGLGVLSGEFGLPLAPHVWESAREYGSHGTVIFLVKDDKGNISAGTSTSGWANGYPGRIGDSPIIGAGLYADSRFGACACTHVGEMTVRASTARSVVLYMKKGSSVEEACREAVQDLRDLQGGKLGAVIIHALDFYGNACVMANHADIRQSSYYLWQTGMPDFEQKPAQVAAD